MVGRTRLATQRQIGLSVEADQVLKGVLSMRSHGAAFPFTSFAGGDIRNNLAVEELVENGLVTAQFVSRDRQDGNEVYRFVLVPTAKVERLRYAATVVNYALSGRKERRMLA